MSKIITNNDNDLDFLFQIPNILLFEIQFYLIIKKSIRNEYFIVSLNEKFPREAIDQVEWNLDMIHLIKERVWLEKWKIKMY